LPRSGPSRANSTFFVAIDRTSKFAFAQLHEHATIRFNHLIPPFNNVALRRALMMAINQTDYMQAANGDHAR
jgi:ABC-type oligopeptide transport system substrate-binding subunit